MQKGGGREERNLARTPSSSSRMWSQISNVIFKRTGKNHRHALICARRRRNGQGKAKIPCVKQEKKRKKRSSEFEK